MNVLVEGVEYLFDLPHVNHVSTRILRRVNGVFVTHTHVDHFVGMGHFLRVNLTRDDTVLLAGPAGFIDNVEGFLSAFTWNLGEDYPLKLTVREFSDGVIKRAGFSCRNHFVRESEGGEEPGNILFRNEILSVSACQLDHGVPVLAFRVDETQHINVNADALKKNGFDPGPWLQSLKTAIRQGITGDTPVETPLGSFPLGDLRDRFIIITPGQKLGYVVDVAYHEENLSNLIPFLRGVDTLYIETAFPEEEEERALERNHLNTRQAARIGAASGVRRIRPLHLSPKYLGREEEMAEQIRRHFPGIVQLHRPYQRSRDENGITDATAREEM